MNATRAPLNDAKRDQNACARTLAREADAVATLVCGAVVGAFVADVCEHARATAHRRALLLGLNDDLPESVELSIDLAFFRDSIANHSYQYAMSSDYAPLWRVAPTTLRRMHVFEGCASCDYDAFAERVEAALDANAVWAPRRAGVGLVDAHTLRVAFAAHV